MTDTHIQITDTSLCHPHNQTSRTVDYDLDRANTLICAGVSSLLVGHTHGLGAERLASCPMALGHPELISRIRSQSTETRISTKANPEFCTPDDLKQARTAGLDEVRIELNPLMLEQLPAFIDQIVGTDIHINLVLRHAANLSRKQVRILLDHVKDRPLHSVILEDTSGSMTPVQVRHIFQMMNDYSAFKSGFSGSDGLGLVAGNCLAAIEGGAGILEIRTGISSDPTGALKSLMAIDRAGFKTGIDVQSLAQSHSLEWAEIVCAWAGIDTAMAPDLSEVATEFNIPSRTLAQRIVQSSGGPEMDRDAIRALAQTLVWEAEQQDSDMAEERAHAS